MSTAMHRLLALGLLAALAAGCAPDSPPTPAGPPVAAATMVERPGAAFPTVAADPTSASAFVAWTEKMEGVTAVMVARWDAGRLAEPVRVSPASDDVAAHGQAPAQVAVGPEGTVYVAWVAQTTVEGRRFPASDLRLARSTDGGRTFSEPVTVNEDEGFLTGHHFHDLAVGPDGTVFVSWLDSRERDRPRPGAHHAAEQTPGRHVHGTDAHGAHGAHEAGTQVRVARSTDGGRTFAPSVVVAEGTCPCCRTNLAVGPDGAVYVAWRHVFGDDIRDIALTRSTDGGRTFAEPVRVHADGWHIAGCPHVGPAVAVDDGGRVHVAWYTGAEGGRGVFYAASDDGGRTFGPARALAAGVPVAQVSASADGAGVWLAWEDPVAERVRVARVGPGEDAPAVVEDVAMHDAPALAARSGRWLLACQCEGGFAVRTGA